jgi:hypothetical protein
MAQELIDKIRAAAQAKGIDPDVAVRIARAESSLKPEVGAKTSTAGGLFGVIDSTWKEFGGTPGKKFDPDENIRVGTDIISSNANYLRKALNRDPRPAEIYAAHYFGPTGAKTFLTADPATPIVDILGQKAVKANPNLQGKTVSQVMAQLETKMGGPKQPDVSRETSAPTRQPLPPSLPPMAATEESSAAPSRLAALGPGYQAALALSFLADTDDKEDRDIDREPGIAEKWLAEQAPRPAALGEFADISIKSPFAPLQPQQPQMLADGGTVQHMSGGGLPFTPTAMVRPSARRELDAIKASYDQYNTDIEAYNKAAEAWNAGPREQDFTMAEPVAPNITQEMFDAKAQAARRDAQNRNLALQVAADPARFGLTSMNKFFADGGMAELTPEEIAAASKPAFLTPKSGIGRKISTKTGELEAAALQGVSEAPYLLAGAPVDLATMAMRPFGYNVEKPMFGAEDLKERALKAGIRQKPPEGKAARALYEMTQLGASAVNPAAPVRGAVAAAEKTGEAAKMLARDFGQYNRQLSVPGASYAVRNKGTPVVISPKSPVTTDDFIFSMNPTDLKAFQGRNPDVALYSDREMAATPEFQAFAAKANAPVDAAEAFVRKDLATTPDSTLNSWFMKALPRYLRSDFASPEDQLVRAAEEGKMVHLAPKKFSDFSDVDAQTQKLLQYKKKDIEQERRTQGFLPGGETSTDYGQRIEALTDIAAYPEQIGDLTPNRVPPSMRNLVETNPEARVMDFAPDINRALKLTELRDKMLEIRALGPKAEYSAYGQDPAKVPDEFLLPDDTLAKLNVAAASNRVARFTRWQDETRQAMATTALRTDPTLRRETLGDGKYIGVALPDIDVHPKYMKLVNDVGCDGGWCTQQERNALGYGSGDAQLFLIVTGEGKTARPVAQISVEKTGRDRDGNSLHSIVDIKEKGNTSNFETSPALPAIQEYVQSLDNLYGGIDYILDVDKLGLTKLSQNPMDLLTMGVGFNSRKPLTEKFGSEQAGLAAVRDEVMRLNNGSQYTAGNLDDVAALVRQATSNVLAPQQRATGGMIERQSTDSRKYL